MPDLLQNGERYCRDKIIQRAIYVFTSLCCSLNFIPGNFIPEQIKKIIVTKTKNSVNWISECMLLGKCFSRWFQILICKLKARGTSQDIEMTTELYCRITRVNSIQCCVNTWVKNYYQNKTWLCTFATLQYSPKIMHAQELLSASARRSSSCGWLRVAWAWVLETARTSLRLHDKNARTSLR